MNARNTLGIAAIATLFAFGSPALGAADDGRKQDTRESLTHLAIYVPNQLDDQRYSAVGGYPARAPEKNPIVKESLTRFIRWMAVLRI